MRFPPRSATTPHAPDESGPQLRRGAPLVPASSIAGRALVTVIAIMTFLASLTAGAAFLVSEASKGWTDQVSREATVQIRPAPGRDLDAEAEKTAALLRGFSGVASVRVFSRAESERLLEPWLGVGLDFSELPVPRLVLLERAAGADLDVAALRKLLAEKAPAASLDDHRRWLERLVAMSRTVVALALMIFVLVLTAMAMAVAFATRGAMDGNRHIIEVLHFVGARDRYIARQFQRHFLRLGGKGGFVGGGAAMLAFLLAGPLTRWLGGSPGADQAEAMFGGFALGPTGYGAILAIGLGIAVLTGFVSKLIVFRHLQRLD
jgi:cell division transport system permease protein